MKTLLSRLVIAITIFVALFGLSTQIAKAASPVLTITNAGNNQIRIEVTGDVNSSVQLYYYNPPNSGVITSAGIIGSTNSSGYFTTTVSPTSYGIPVGTSVFVNVNNQQSASVTWPTITGGNVYLGQSNVWLSAGQNTTVTVSGGTGYYYVSSNSNSNVATASISGSVLTVNGVNSGNTTLTICSASAGSSCASLYVTVSGGYYYGQSITFSQNNLSVQAGQTQSVSIYGGGSYYLSNNSNSSVASVTISGSTLNVYGFTNGATTVTICSQTSGSSCGSLYVTVYSSYGNYYGGTDYYSGNYYPYNRHGFTPGSGYGFSTGYQSTNYTYTYPQYTYTQPVTYVEPITTYVQPTVVKPTSYGKPVTGVYLNQVPSTGIDFNLKVILFLLGLISWSAAIAYFVINSRTKMKSRLVTTTDTVMKTKAELFKLKQLQKSLGK